MTDPTKAPDQELDALLNIHFAGKVVRKDLTKLLREGANVPVYVLEYLLGLYCASGDEATIADGLATVKRILAENYVRPDEAEKVKSKIRELGTFKVIDKVSVTLNERRDCYEALLSNLGVKGAEIGEGLVRANEKLLAGGVWAIVTVGYFYEEGQKGSPFAVTDLRPIQMPNFYSDELYRGRAAFTEDQWIDVLLRSIGMEPANLATRVKWHLLARMVPLVENNYNVCELGPRGTGKSHVYKEISPNAILVSGGQTSVANLFYNLASRRVGLVGLWDVVAFDEVAGISFKDKDGVQIMKDYMASGSFARGRDAISAQASMVFVGNINQSVDVLLKVSHLLAPFPEAMIDTAFFDRFHAYIPGWEIPKMRPELFTNRFGLIVDYLAEYMREMRKTSAADSIDRHFALGRDLNQRDTIAVRRTTSGLLKLLYPAGDHDKEAVRRCLEYALEARRRVKEQLKRIGGIEFYDVQFGYRDLETLDERFIGVPEQGSGTLVSDAVLDPGTLHTVLLGHQGHRGVYRLETQMTPGSGKHTTSGLSSFAAAKEAARVGFDYLRANVARISSSAHVGDFDYHLHVVELQGTGPSKSLGLAAFMAYASALLKRPFQSQLAVLGEMSLGGSIAGVEGLAECLQIAHDAGVRKVLIPMASVADIATVPGELFARFQVAFYSDPLDAALKALKTD